MITSSQETQAQDQEESNSDTLIYVGDPMCSWCYGFAPQVEKLKAYCVDNQITFKLVLGGLRPNGTETMADLSSFLTGHWEEVHKRTNQPFKYDILKESDFVYNTEPSCRAVATVGIINPEVELAFFVAVQKAFYNEGKHTDDINTYLEIARDLKIDTNEFERIYNSKQAIDATKDDFAAAAQMGIRGFPSVALFHSGKGYLLSNGHEKAENIIKQLEKTRVRAK